MSIPSFDLHYTIWTSSTKLTQYLQSTCNFSSQPPTPLLSTHPTSSTSSYSTLSHKTTTYKLLTYYIPTKSPLQPLKFPDICRDNQLPITPPSNIIYKNYNLAEMTNQIFSQSMLWSDSFTIPQFITTPISSSKTSSTPTTTATPNSSPNINLPPLIDHHIPTSIFDHLNYFVLPQYYDEQPIKLFNNNPQYDPTTLINPLSHTIFPLSSLPINKSIKSSSITSQLQLPPTIVSSLPSCLNPNLQYSLSLIAPTIILTPIPYKLLEKNTQILSSLHQGKPLSPYESNNNNTTNTNNTNQTSSLNTSLISNPSLSSSSSSSSTSIQNNNYDLYQHIPPQILISSTDLLHQRYLSNLSQQRLLSIHTNWVCNNQTLTPYIDNSIDSIPDLDELEETERNLTLAFELLLAPLLTSHGWIFCCDLKNEQQFTNFYSLLNVFLPMFLTLLLPPIDFDGYIATQENFDTNLTFINGISTSLSSSTSSTPTGDNINMTSNNNNIQNDNDITTTNNKNNNTKNDKSNNNKRKNDTTNDSDNDDEFIPTTPLLPDFECFETHIALYTKLKFLFSRHIRQIPQQRQHCYKNWIQKIRFLFFQSSNYSLNDTTLSTMTNTPHSTIPFSSNIGQTPLSTTHFQQQFSTMSNKNSTYSTTTTPTHNNIPFNTHNISSNNINNNVSSNALTPPATTTSLKSIQNNNNNNNTNNNNNLHHSLPQIVQDDFSIFHNERLLLQFPSTPSSKNNPLHGDIIQNNNTNNDDNGNNIYNIQHHHKLSSHSQYNGGSSSNNDILSSSSPAALPFIQESSPPSHLRSLSHKNNTIAPVSEENDNDDISSNNIINNSSMNNNNNNKFNNNKSSLISTSTSNGDSSSLKLDIYDEENDPHHQHLQQYFSSSLSQPEDNIFTTSNNNDDDHHHNNNNLNHDSFEEDIDIYPESIHDNEIINTTQYQQSLYHSNYHNQQQQQQQKEQEQLQLNIQEQTILHRKEMIQICINKLLTHFEDRLIIEQCDLYDDLNKNISNNSTPNNKSSSIATTPTSFTTISQSGFNNINQSQLPQQDNNNNNNNIISLPGTGNISPIELSAIHRIMNKMILEHVLILDQDSNYNIYGSIGHKYKLHHDKGHNDKNINNNTNNIKSSQSMKNVNGNTITASSSSRRSSSNKHDDKKDCTIM